MNADGADAARFASAAAIGVDRRGLRMHPTGVAADRWIRDRTAAVDAEHRDRGRTAGAHAVPTPTPELARGFSWSRLHLRPGRQPTR